MPPKLLVERSLLGRLRRMSLLVDCGNIVDAVITLHSSQLRPAAVESGRAAETDFNACMSQASESQRHSAGWAPTGKTEHEVVPLKFVML